MSGESLTPQQVGHIYVYSLFIGSFYIICLFRVFIGNLSTFLFSLTDQKCMRWLPKQLGLFCRFVKYRER